MGWCGSCSADFTTPPSFPPLTRGWRALEHNAGGKGDDFTAPFGSARYDIPGLAGKQEAAANFVATFATERGEALRKGGYTVVFGEYSWAVNAR